MGYSWPRPFIIGYWSKNSTRILNCLSCGCGVLVPQRKVKFLVWLSLNRALPTNSPRASRKLACTSASCPKCLHHSESILHCFRDCSSVTSIWLQLNMPLPHDFFFVTDAATWIKSSACGPSSQLYLSDLRWLWIWRNEVIFNRSSWTSSSVVSKMLNSQRDFIQYFPTKSSTKQLQHATLCWLTPLEIASSSTSTVVQILPHWPSVQEV